MPWAIYGLTHIVLTTLLDAGVLPFPSPKLLDTSLPLIDAIARSAAIVGAVENCRNHPLPAVKQSLFAQLFLGAVASAGGGVTAGTLGVWEHDWRFRRPSFLNGGVIATLDLWGGSLAAFIYGFLQLSHPWYGEVYEAYGFKPIAPLTPLGARSVSVIVLTGLYVTRVVSTHYSGSASKPAPPSKKKQLEAKSQ